MHKLYAISLFAMAIAGAAACTGQIDGEPFVGPPPDPYEELERIQREGPPRYTSRVHGCTKLRYRTLGNVLASRGVNLDATGPLTAGGLYKSGASALGAPSYVDRVRETIELGVATTAKLFDIFVQAAPEIIANLPNRPECTVGGVGAALFDAANRCNADGVSCLIGVPATAAHLEICNQTVRQVANVESGKRLAVAVLAAAAHTCE
jgi:hypothetical protein